MALLSLRESSNWDAKAEMEIGCENEISTKM